MTTKKKLTHLATIHTKKSFLDAVTRLLGPRPSCDACRSDYPFDLVWLVLTGGRAYLRASRRGFAASVCIYSATTAKDAVDESIPIDVGHLFDIADAMPEGAVVTRESTTGDDDGFASVRFTGDRASLNVPMAAIDASRAPMPPEITAPLALLPSAMLQVLERVRMAMGPGKSDIKNKATHGARLEFQDRTLRAVTTDGHRLHIAEHVGTVPFPETAPMLVPGGLVAALCYSLSHHMTNGSIPPLFHMAYGTDYVAAQVGNDTFRCDREHGLAFPPYDFYGALPGDRPVARVISDEIVEYLSRVMALRTNPYVALTLSTDRLTCRAEVTTSCVNDSFGLTLDDRFRVDYEGDTRYTKVHAEYLCEALTACESRALLSLGTEQADPITLDGDGCKVVLMPRKFERTDPEFGP